MDWISVNDKLPENAQTVKIKGQFPFEVICIFLKTEKGYTFYLKKEGHIRNEFYGITHWMPLPKPPEL